MASHPLEPIDDAQAELRHILARLGVSEIAYRELIERLPVVVFLESPRPGVGAVSISPRIEGLLGLPAESLVGPEERWDAHVHPDDAAWMLPMSAASDESGEPFAAEYRILAADGHEVWVREETVLVRDDLGDPICWQGYLLDVTRRKTAERARDEAEGSRRTLIETIPAVTYVLPFGADHFTYVSPQIASMLGYAQHEWTPAMWEAVLHPEDRDAAIAEAIRVDRTFEPFAMEFRMRAADGRYLWISDRSVLGYDAKGTPSNWQGVMYDITPLKEAEAHVREAEARFRTVVEHNPAALYIEDLNPDWVGTVYASPVIEGITGYSPHAWTSDPDLWHKIVHPDDLAAVTEAERRCIEEGAPFEMDLRLIRPDGSVVWVHDRAVLVHDERGEPLFWQGFFLDITDKKQAEQEVAWALELERESVEQLQALDEMKNMFVTAVSHELRSPLAAILGSAMTLEQLDGSLSDADRRGLVGGIITKAQRLNALVEDLLDLERLRRGVIQIARVRTDLAPVVQASIDAAEIGDRRLVPDLEAVTMAADPSMIERMVENLLTNAGRYTPVGSTVWVRLLETANAGAEIVVEDDGPGVPEAMHAELFDAFRQGPNALAHSPGVGVGLTIVARFAEAHGGSAWVEERPGGGASFHVTIEPPAV